MGMLPLNEDDMSSRFPSSIISSSKSLGITPPSCLGKLSLDPKNSAAGWSCLGSEPNLETRLLVAYRISFASSIVLSSTNMSRKR